MPPVADNQRRVRGRYAPSPTGFVHLGNARTALAAWLSVRSQGGSFIWRLEDLDPPRIQLGAAEAAIEDLAWLGLDWDEGPDIGGPFEPYVQSQRHDLYDAALVQLAATDRLFPCSLSRRDIQEISSAPHGGGVAPAYPPELRPRPLAPDWFARFCSEEQSDSALRFLVEDGDVVFRDLVQGVVRENVAGTVGDFVLKRRDGQFAYQLAVVVDDAAMDISEVVRGADLLASTARQIQLIQTLGAPVPRYAHVPVVLNAEGDKLSKRDDALTVRAMRSDGVLADQIVGFLAHSLGIIPAQVQATPQDLVSSFRWGDIPLEPVMLPKNIVALLRRV